MEDPNPEGFTEPPPIPELVEKDRKAGWWAWPLIVLSIAYIVFQTQNQPAESEAGVIGEVNEDGQIYVTPATDLAILEVQGKLAVGISMANPVQSQQTVNQLEATVTSDTTAFAVAALHRFVNFNGKGMTKAEATLDKRRKSAGANPEYLERVWQALSAGVSEKEREAWSKQIGWFGSILPEDAEGTVPNRAKIQSEGLFVAGLMTTAMGMGFLGGFVGLALLITALVMRSNGKFSTRFKAFQQPAGVFLEAFAIYLTLMALTDLLGIYLEKNGPEVDDAFQVIDLTYFLPQVCFVAAFVIGLFWPCARGLGRKRIFQLLGIHRGQGIGREILAGFVGYLAMIPVAALGIVVTFILMLAVGIDATGLSAQEGVDAEPAAIESTDQAEDVASPIPAAPSHPAAEWVAIGGWKMKLFVFVLAAIIAPLFEETMFRGALFRAFRSRWGFIVSALIGGFIFAIIHPQGWLAAPALTAMGVGFAVIREWRDSLIAPMVAHAVNNGLIVGGLVLVL
ncbi:CPBP family intramembrane metalloprotease [Verrucomicrobiales bacterium]|nr:CPBP family intramembrane metalloprotease [Verrucomicrobiales bacterium]